MSIPYAPDLGGLEFKNVIAITGTVVKTGPGCLDSIIINTPLALAVITVYDGLSASGTKIATMTFPAALLSTGPQTIKYGARFSTGLFINLTGAAADITMIFS